MAAMIQTRNIFKDSTTKDEAAVTSGCQYQPNFWTIWHPSAWCVGLPDNYQLRAQTAFEEMRTQATFHESLPHTTRLLARFAGFTSASSSFTGLSERSVFKMADAAAVFGNDVAVSAELVLVGR